MVSEAIQNLTLLDIGLIVAFIVGLIEGVKKLKKMIKDFFKGLLDDQFAALNVRLNDIDKQTCKNFLVRYLADIERGELIYDAEQQRFWEEYDHYVDELHENSYVKEWVAKLKKEGKLVRPAS